MRFQDGTFEAAGLDGVKACMKKDYAPSGKILRDRLRERVRKSFRKMKERPEWFFRRLDHHIASCKRVDPEFRLAPDELATIYLTHTGLDQRERAEIFRESGASWENPKGIRDKILERYEQAHELDEQRTLNSRYFQNHPNRSAVRFMVCGSEARGQC